MDHDWEALEVNHGFVSESTVGPRLANLHLGPLMGASGSLGFPVRF